MLKTWSNYQKLFFEQALQFEISYIDKIMLGTLITAVAFCGLSSNIGQDVGDYEKLQLVKLKAQQETIALRPIELSE